MSAAVKQVQRCATVAFRRAALGALGCFARGTRAGALTRVLAPRSSTAPLLAVGTMAGAVDLSFSTTACLEVCNRRRASGSPGTR